MALGSLSYHPPIRRYQEWLALDYDRYEAAVALYQQGRHREAVQQVFAHVFPGQEIPDLATVPFRFTQGSSRVSARIEGDQLAVQVPLVRLPAGGRSIAALRYVLTRISGSGQIHQPRLHGDDLHLEFREDIARLHPAKVIEALRRMPREADNTDDWLVAQFGATPLERESVAPLEPEELAAAETVWRAHWSEVEALLEEARQKRSMFFLNEVSAYAVNRIEFVLPLCGVLSARIAEGASTFNNTDVDPHKRETALSKCCKEMAAVRREDLERSLGHAQYAISRLADGSPALIANWFGAGSYMENVDKLRKSGKPMDAALALLSTYYYLLARFQWPPVVREELCAGLAAPSDKPWREAANVLWDQARALVAKFGSDEEADEDEDDQDDDG